MNLRGKIILLKTKLCSRRVVLIIKGIFSECFKPSQYFIGKNTIVIKEYLNNKKRRPQRLKGVESVSKTFIF